GAVGRDLADLGLHLADLAAAGHRALLLHHAGHPHPALHAVVLALLLAALLLAAPLLAAPLLAAPLLAAPLLPARVAAVVVPLAQAAQAIAEGLPVRVLFAALPVPLVHAAGDHLGLGDVAVAGTAHGPFLAHRHADADGLALIDPLGNAAVAG